MLTDRFSYSGAKVHSARARSNMVLGSEFSWHIWAFLVAFTLLPSLSIYTWHRRHVPGARAFIAQTSFTTIWIFGIAMQLVSKDVQSRIFWMKFESLWQMPATVAALCFALEYANFERILTRRTLIVLIAPVLLYVVLVLTNDLHHWVWIGTTSESYSRPNPGNIGYVIRIYGYLVSFATPLVFIWLFVRSPLHRLPAALCLIAQIVLRIVYVLSLKHGGAFWTVDALVLALLFLTATYALCLLNFRFFELVPVARGTVVDQMSEGMLVFDTQHHIIDLNPSAGKILGLSASAALGGNVLELSPALARLNQEQPGWRTTRCRLHLNRDGVDREYVLHSSELKNWRGYPLGYSVLFRDVTEQRHAETRVLAQQRAVATLQERVRVARELHDGVAQVLAYVGIQADVAQSYLKQEQPAEAARRLNRIAAAAQDAMADVREYIHGAGQQRGEFLPTLERYVSRFGENHGIGIVLDIHPEIARRGFDPTVEAQLERMVQEALTNVRKHAQANSIDIRIQPHDGEAEIVVEDDGDGFEPAKVDSHGQRFGLRFVRERAAEVGGKVSIDSAPGRGTRVIIRVPLRKEQP